MNRDQLREIVASASPAALARMRADPRFMEALAPTPSKAAAPAVTRTATIAPAVTIAADISIDVTLPIRLVSITNIGDWKVRNRAKKPQRDEVVTHFGHLGWLLQAALPLEVRMTRVAPKALDNDNLQASAKHVRDALARCIGVDDRDPRVTWHTVEQRRGGVREYGVRIEIWSRGGDDTNGGRR